MKLLRGFLSILALCAACSWPGLSAAADRIALVIGNAGYRHLPALTTPSNDARAMAEMLRKAGFEVTEKIDLNREQMTAALESFGRAAGTARLAVFYYSGHGFAVEGQQFLVPVDGKVSEPKDLETNAVTIARLLAEPTSYDRPRLIFLDAGRSRPRAAANAPRPTLGSLGVPAGVVIGYATAPDMPLGLAQGPNSPYAAALVRHLATAGLEVRQTLTRIRSDVMNATDMRQIPWDLSTLRGDVYLVTRSP